jgi:hypothetical protein
MNSKTIDLKITINEDRKVEVKNLTHEEMSKDELWHFFYIAYLYTNLESAIADLISQMIKDEQMIIVESSISYSSAKKREKMIRDLTTKFEKTVRERLAKNKNYLQAEGSKGKKKIDLVKEQTLFDKKFIEICDALRADNKKLNKINSAQKMFGQNSNHHQQLKRKLNDLNWSFQDVLNSYLEK